MADSADRRGANHGVSPISESERTITTAAPAKGAIAFLVFSAFISSMGFGLASPVLPKLVMELAGTDLADAARWGGLAVFVYAIMQFVFAPILGALSDRYGRRPILLLSLAAFAVDMLVLGLVTSLWAFVLVRALAGIFAATFSTTNAYIADITPRAERGRRFAFIGAAFGAGFIFGPALGGILGEIDVRLPFLVGAGIAALNTAFGYFVVPESLSPEKRRAFSWSRANTLGTLLQLFRTPRIRLLLPVYFFAQLSSWVYPTVWSYVAIERFGWADRAVGFSIAYYGVIAFLSSALVIQYLLPRMGVVRAILLALIVEAVALTGLGLANADWMVYALITLSLLSAMQDPAIRQELSNRVAEDAQGELQGGLSALTSIAMIISPALYMALFTLTAGDDAVVYLPGSPFLVAAALSLLTLVLYLPTLRHRSDTSDSST